MGSIITLIQRMLSGLLNAIRTTTIQEELFVLGGAFSYEDYLIVPSGGAQIIFDPTAFEGTNLTFSPLIFAAESGPVLVDIYTGTDADDDGTLLIPSNRREGQPQPKSVIRLNPTVNSLGTKFAGDSVLASGAGIGNVNSNANSPGLPFEIDTSVKKALDIDNTSGGDIIFQIKLQWFES